MPPTPQPTTAQATPTPTERECTRCNSSLSATSIPCAFNGAPYCDPCYEDLFMECEECEEVIEREEAHEYDGRFMCDSCYDDQPDLSDNQDSSSDFRDRDELPVRDWSTRDLPELQSRDQGTTITSSRIFSAEVECYDRDNNIGEIAAQIPQAFGISYDGSLNDGGVEFQTAKLRGAAGEEAMTSFLATLNRYGCTTDRSCGLHIHLDGRGLLPRRRTKDSPHNLRALFLIYLAFEDVLLSFLPPSRRGNNYCRLLRSAFHSEEIQKAHSLEEMEKLWYRVHLRKEVAARKDGKYDNSRYYGVNFHSLLRDGHLEVRYHSGTTNATKVLEWINLHQRIMDAAVDRMTYSLPAVECMTALSEKTAALFDLLRLSPASRAYFLERQKAFTSTATDNDEAVNETPVCVG